MTIIKEWSIYSSTGDVFDGKNLISTWNKENKCWSKNTENIDYSFPELQNSKFCEQGLEKLDKANICQDIYYSQDGTSIVTVNSDYGIRQYLIPDESKDERTNKTTMVPFKRFFKPQSIVSSTVHPNYSIFNENSDSNLILLSLRDMPLQAVSLSVNNNSQNKPIFKYDLMNSQNERFNTPYTVKFCAENQFLTGSMRNVISLYDVNKKEPIWTFKPTKRSINKSHNKAIVSCFNETSYENISAVFMYFGTYKNEVGRVDKRQPIADIIYSSKGGNGIYQLISSNNEHFMYSFKRNSETIEVLDIRKNCRKVNEIMVPFKIKNQKFKGTLTASNGLLLGTDYGSIIQWSSSAIEFGGLCMDNNSKNDSVLEKTELKVQTCCSRINIVKSNPNDSDSIAISHSPDKFNLNNQTDIYSGLTLLKCSID